MKVHSSEMNRMELDVLRFLNIITQKVCYYIYLSTLTFSLFPKFLLSFPSAFVFLGSILWLKIGSVAV